MAEKEIELSFDTSPCEKGMLVRIHAEVFTPDPIPLILKELLTILWGNGDISPLTDKFPQYAKELKKLKKVLSRGAINKEQTDGYYYHHIHGYSVYAVIELPPEEPKN